MNKNYELAVRAVEPELVDSTQAASEYVTHTEQPSPLEVRAEEYMCAQAKCAVPEEAQQERAPVHDQRELQSSVSLSVRKEDHTILVAIIDRTASQTKIMNDLRQELPKFAVPYRNVDQRILEAIRVKSARNLTDDEAALCVFGDASYARKIRYWQNRWELQ